MLPAGCFFENPGLEQVSVEIFLSNKTRLRVQFLDRCGSRYLLPVMESRDPFFGVSVSSTSRDFHRSFFMKFCKKEFLKKNVLKNDCSTFCRSKNVYEMEKTICPLPRLKFILNSIKNVHVPMKPQRVISATRGWE